MSRQFHRSTVRSVGQLVVDIALLLPVFVILTCGLVEFSRAVAVHQAMQDAVDEVAVPGVTAVTDADLERSVQTSLSDTLGADADQIDVHSRDSVVCLALPGESVGGGPVSFLAGTTISAIGANGK